MRAAVLAGLMLFSWAGIGAAAAQVQDAPVVLELFTSQGCSSCPPADALLGRLKASDPGLLPLSLHVDYWNRLGWRDPYSAASMTARQYDYARLMGADGVYTPELVVGGAEAVIGSDPGAVAEAIRRARARQALSPPVKLSAVREGGEISIAAGAGPGSGRLLLVGYDDRHMTAVRDGENEGRTLTDTDVVRALVPLGPWTGAAVSLRAPSPAGEHAAVLLQAEDGHILAARAVQ